MLLKWCAAGDKIGVSGSQMMSFAYKIVIIRLKGYKSGACGGPKFSDVIHNKFTIT